MDLGCITGVKLLKTKMMHDDARRFCMPNNKSFRFNHLVFSASMDELALNWWSNPKLGFVRARVGPIERVFPWTIDLMLS